MTTISDARRRGFFIIDNEIISAYGPQIGATGVAVYAALCRYAGEAGEAWPAIPTLAAALAISQRTVQYAIRKLEAAGLIQVTRRKTQNGGPASNLYTILHIQKEKAAPAADSDGGVVQIVHQGGATDAPGVVQIVHPKKTHMKKTQEGGARPRNPLMDQLAEMCYGSTDSLKAKGVGAKLGAALRDLRAVAPDITADALRALATWWAESDFRGRKGERPQPHQVADAWLRMNAGRATEPRPIIDVHTGKITYQW